MLLAQFIEQVVVGVVGEGDTVDRGRGGSSGHGDAYDGDLKESGRGLEVAQGDHAAVGFGEAHCVDFAVLQFLVGRFMRGKIDVLDVDIGVAGDVGEHVGDDAFMPAV